MLKRRRHLKLKERELLKLKVGLRRSSLLVRK
jgi:hypothetical protein